MCSQLCLKLAIYRPGSSFFEDLAESLDRVVGYSAPVYIIGDLNVRLNRGDDSKFFHHRVATPL